MVPSEDPLEDCTSLDLRSLLTFITGSDHLPPMYFSNEPEIKFEVDCNEDVTHSKYLRTNPYLPIILTDPDTKQNGCSFNLCTWIWFSLTHITANLDYGVLQLAGCGYVLNIHLIIVYQNFSKDFNKIVCFISL